MTIATIYPSHSSLKVFYPSRFTAPTQAEIRRAGDVNGDGIADVILSLPPIEGQPRDKAL